MQDIRSRLAKGAVLVVVARAAGNLVQFGSTLVLARILLPADFGLVALATATLIILKSVTDMSLTEALIQHPSPTPAHLDTAFTLNALRGVLLMVGLAAAAFPLALMTREPRLLLLLLVLSPSVALESLVNPRLALKTKDLIFWQLLVVNLGQKLLGAIVCVAAALVWRNYWALVVGQLASQAVTPVISFVLVRYRPRFSLRHVKEILSFSVWLTLSQALNQINWRFDNFLVGSLLGRTALGYYSVGDNLATMPTREATMPLWATLFPAFARVREFPDQLARAYQRAQTLLTAVAVPLGVGTALIAAPLVRVALGEKWLAATLVVQVLAPAATLQTMGSLAQSLGLAVGESRLLFKRDVQNFCIRLPMIGGGMYFWGLPGALYGRAASVLVENYLNLTIARQITGLSYWSQLTASWRSLVSGLVMVVAVLACPMPAGPIPRIAVSVVVGAFAYIGAHLLLWLASRRPDGPEQEVLGMISKVLPSRLTV